VVRRDGSAQAGTYTCMATNSAGSATSAAATLTVSPTADFGRLINLSILTPLSSAEGSPWCDARRPRHLRQQTSPHSRCRSGAVDPRRARRLAGPQTGTAVEWHLVGSNNDWAGVPALAAAFAAVGAFNYGATASKDAALYKADAVSGGYTILVSDNAGGSGTVIAEVYDATPAATFTATTPRLINLAVLKQINPGGVSTTGFVISGSTAKTVLVRAIGPGLTPLGVGGAMADPKLELFAGSAVVAANDNWAGAPHRRRRVGGRRVRHRQPFEQRRHASRDARARQLHRPTHRSRRRRRPSANRGLRGALTRRETRRPSTEPRRLTRAGRHETSTFFTAHQSWANNLNKHIKRKRRAACNKRRQLLAGKGG